jgi:Transmembrane secretion effector
MTEADTTGAVSTWAPLRIRMFRIIWLAHLGSNIGTWMQMVGAQWLLVEEPRASDRPPVPRRRPSRRPPG